MILTLLPDSTLFADAPWAAVGAGSIDLALRDASDASYVQADGSVAGAVVFGVSMSTATIPAGALIHSVRLVARMNPMAGATAIPGIILVSMGDYPGSGGGGGIRIGVSSIAIPFQQGQQRVIAGTADYVADACSFSGGPWDQGKIDRLTVTGLFSDAEATAIVRIYELRVEVDVEFPASVVVTAPPAEVRSPNPAVGWDVVTLAGAPPVSLVDVAIYSPNQYQSGGFAPNDDAGIYNVTLPYQQASDDTPIGVSLPPGRYRAYVRARMPIGCSDSGVLLDSAPSYREFVVLPIPDVTAVPPGIPARLDCGVWEAVVCERGGNPIGSLPIGSLSGSLRVLNDTATMTVDVPAVMLASCRSLLTLIRPYEHEISLIRDGREQYVGIPGTMTPGPDGVSIPLADLGAWADVRAIPRDRDLSDLDLAEIWLTVWSDVLDVENSMGLRVSAALCGVTGSRILYAGQSLAGDALRSLTAGGVDVTVVRRDVIAGGLEVPLRPLGTLTDQHTGGYHVRPMARTASEIIGLGQGGGAIAVPLTAVAGGVEDRLGLVQRIIQVPDAATADELQAAVAATYALLGDTQIVEAPLTYGAPWAIEQLVAGARLDVTLVESAFPAVGAGRIERVNVNAAGGADGWSETITVVVQPLGVTS